MSLGCGGDAPADAPAWEWNLPEGVPEPKVPEDNPMSVEKVELGRFLFYEKKLSGNETQSCGSCHQQELAFTDGLAFAVGSTGQIHPRSSMSVANAGYAATLTWANNVLVRLEPQARVPMFGEDPVELGLAGLDLELLQRLKNDPIYPDMFASAFPEENDPITVDNITKALASFQRQLTSFNARADQWQRGEVVLTDSEKRGLALFFGGTSEAGVEDAVECFHCHGGFLYSQSTNEIGQVFDQSVFVNNGLYNLDTKGSYPPGNEGLFDLTGKVTDKGRFKPPSLRNIALTAPYMHDGSIETLEEVIDHYAAGGRTIDDGDFAGNGSMNPNKSAFVNGFVLTDQEKRDLIAFLNALTDETFITNEAFSDPFAE